MPPRNSVSKEEGHDLMLLLNPVLETRANISLFLYHLPGLQYGVISNRKEAELENPEGAQQG